jgi:hypothetical protein
MSTTQTSIKRHSLEEARTIIDKLGRYCFDDFHPLFKEGKVPLFEEIEGKTLGSFLVLGPNTGWWRKLGLMIFFDNSLARWTGKRFITPFDDKKRGEGINLFQSRILPERFPVYTYINKSLFDQNLCLTVAYPRFPSSLFGLIDQLRKIDEGVFLGQGHHKPLWGREYSLQGYFILCALNHKG